MALCENQGAEGGCRRAENWGMIRMIGMIGMGGWMEVGGQKIKGEVDNWMIRMIGMIRLGQETGVGGQESGVRGPRIVG